MAQSQTWNSPTAPTASKSRSGVKQGSSFPLGATSYLEGVNFSVHSKSCTAMELLLFDDVDSETPSRVIRLDPNHHRTDSLLARLGR